MAGREAHGCVALAEKMMMRRLFTNADLVVIFSLINLTNYRLLLLYQTINEDDGCYSRLRVL